MCRELHSLEKENGGAPVRFLLGKRDQPYAFFSIGAAVLCGFGTVPSVLCVLCVFLSCASCVALFSSGCKCVVSVL